MLNFLEKLAHRAAPRKPQQPAPALPAMLNFDFIGETLDNETQTSPHSAQAKTLGRTEACVAKSLSSAACLQSSNNKASNLVYLQSDARTPNVREEHQIFKRETSRRASRTAAKVRATGLLDASELIKAQKSVDHIYRKERAHNQVLPKEISLQMLRRLNQRDGEDELYNKVKSACQKVSAEALINGPSHPKTGPLRQMIRIKIG